MINNSITNLALQFVLYVVVQVVILNGIDYMHVFTPFLFILYILTLPMNISRIAQMLHAFAIGIVVDIFSNTIGINAMVCVFMAYIRPGICKFFASTENQEQQPSFKSYGMMRFMQYAFIMVLVHHTGFYMLENMSLSNMNLVATRIICSAVFTLILIFSVEYFKYRQVK